MKLMLKLFVCASLTQACGAPEMPSSRHAPAVQAAHPDALTDEQIAELEKEAVRLEKELKLLSGESDLYSSAVSNMLAGVAQELPDLGGDEKKGDANTRDWGTDKDTDGKDTSNGKNPDYGQGKDSGKGIDNGGNQCSEKCGIIKEIIRAIKTGDCHKAKEQIKELKEAIKTKRADYEKKLQDCREKIKKAWDCRGKNKDGGNGKDDWQDKDDNGKGDGDKPNDQWNGKNAGEDTPYGKSSSKT